MSFGRDPIAVLMEEHQAFLQRLTVVRAEIARVGAAEPVPADVIVAMDQFSRFLRDDVDGFHGRKEEQGLFPVLVRHVVEEGGPVGVMKQEHEALRRLQRTIAGHVARLEVDRAATEAWSAVATAGHEVDQLLIDHIDKEDHGLFPMAQSLLTRSEIDEVATICREIEERRDPPR